MKLQTRIILGYSGVCLVWGMSWSAIKIGLESFPPILFASYRFALAALLILFFLRRDFFTALTNPTFWKIVVLLCFLAFSLPITLMNIGQTVVSSSLAAVLFATYPLWVGITSHVLLPEDRLTLQQFIGILCAFAGVAVLFQPAQSDTTSAVFLGMILILGSAFLQALSLVFIRKYAQNFSSLHYNFFAMLLSALVLYTISSVIETTASPQWTWDGVFSLLFLGFLGTAGTFVIYFWLTRHLPPVVLSLSAFITPVLAILLGVFILQEEWTPLMTLGTSCILIGILITLVDARKLFQRHSKERRM